MYRISTYVGSDNRMSRLHIETQSEESLAQVLEKHVAAVKKAACVNVVEKVQEEKHPLEEIFEGRSGGWGHPAVNYALSTIDIMSRKHIGAFSIFGKKAVDEALHSVAYRLIVMGYFPNYTDVLKAAVLQATKGKGQRHGGDKTPFLEQPWVRLYGTHGLGFLLGQADKKYHEACGKENKEDAEREFLGAIVYLGMALLVLEGKVK